jgi:acyl-CoA thioester hydrolase
MAKWHLMHHEVLFNECDLTGIVYHPNYFRWFEQARFEIAKQVRIHVGFEDPNDIIFPVIESKCKFIFPLNTGMKITIKTKLDMPKTAKLDFTHMIYSEDNIKYTEGTTSVAIVSKSEGLLTKLTDNLKELITSYLTDESEERIEK